MLRDGILEGDSQSHCDESEYISHDNYAIVKKYYRAGEPSLLYWLYLLLLLLFFSFRYVLLARLGYWASVFDPDCVREPRIIAG